MWPSTVSSAAACCTTWPSLICVVLSFSVPMISGIVSGADPTVTVMPLIFSHAMFEIPP
jgi:uncharacterized membrane protein SpoIIM required for sporulation